MTEAADRPEAISVLLPVVPPDRSPLPIDHQDSPTVAVAVANVSDKAPAFSGETTEGIEGKREATIAESAAQPQDDLFGGSSDEAEVSPSEPNCIGVAANCPPTETSVDKMEIDVPGVEDQSPDGVETTKFDEILAASEVQQVDTAATNQQCSFEPLELPAAIPPLSTVGLAHVVAAVGNLHGLDELADPKTSADTYQARPTTPYRPRLRERSPATTQRPPPSSQQTQRAAVHHADLMLIFQPGGWDINVSLLLRRDEDIPEKTAVRIGEETIHVLAIDDMYFEPIPLQDIAAVLQLGISVETSDKPKRRWVRTQRKLHVFSERPGIPGFASVPRVVIGQENVILCDIGISAAVLDFCQAAGADSLVEVTGPTVVQGWRCFRSCRPKRPVDRPDAEDILLALNPLPDAEIQLTGGISITRGSWIADRPPAIRIIGAEPTEGEVEIDDRPATLSGGSWTIPGWDKPGQHIVRYAGLSKSYEIAKHADNWSEWPAHPGKRFSICGALVSSHSGFHAKVFPLSGCWLLGAQPGQVAWATPSVLGLAIAAPSFEPVWAILPRLGRTRRQPQLLVTDTPPLRPAHNTSPSALRQWSQLLRDAPTRIDEPSIDALWQEYRHAARILRTGRRR